MDNRIIKFFIPDSLIGSVPELQYLLTLWAKNSKVRISFSANPDNAVVLGSKIGLGFSPDLFSSPRFNNASLIENKNGAGEILTTAFYMINSLQEYDAKDLDVLNRFKYKNSYQHRLNNVKHNVVQRCFDELSRRAGVPLARYKSSFFLSHDIDTVNGAIIEDGFNAIKRGRLDQFLRMLFNVAIGKPDWLNMDKIRKLESEYDCRSLFFWIVNQGKINSREKNADYALHSRKMQNEFMTSAKLGFENGLHKSISNELFAEEMGKYGSTPMANRYHYLKFNLPSAYHDIEKAGLAMDASLGFAEVSGFRNSYGLPFNPFNMESRRPYSFLEVPLHIMDRTYFQYQKYSVQQTEKDIFDFFEKQKENCVISILWHNNFFTDFKFAGYLNLYKKILMFIKENQFKTVLSSDLIKDYSITNGNSYPAA